MPPEQATLSALAEEGGNLPSSPARRPVLSTYKGTVLELHTYRVSWVSFNSSFPLGPFQSSVRAL